MCVFPCWPLATGSKKGAKIYHKLMFEKFVLNIKPTYLHSCKLALHVSRVETISSWEHMHKLEITMSSRPTEYLIICVKSTQTYIVSQLSMT